MLDNLYMEEDDEHPRIAALCQNLNEVEDDCIDLDLARGELEHAQSELKESRKALKAARDELTAARDELMATQQDQEHLKGVNVDLRKAKADLSSELKDDVCHVVARLGGASFTGHSSSSNTSRQRARTSRTPSPDGSSHLPASPSSSIVILSPGPCA